MCGIAGTHDDPIAEPAFRGFRGMIGARPSGGATSKSALTMASTARVSPRPPRRTASQRGTSHQALHLDRFRGWPKTSREHDNEVVERLFSPFAFGVEFDALAQP